MASNSREVTCGRGKTWKHSGGNACLKDILSGSGVVGEWVSRFLTEHTGSD